MKAKQKKQTYVILPPKYIEFAQHLMVKIFLRNDTSLK